MPFSRVTHAPMAGPVPFRFRFDYDIAFQAIFDMRQETVWAYEALVRGPNGETAEEAINAIPAPAMYAADQMSRETAIWLAAELGMTERLSLNFLRSALLAPEDYIAATLNAAQLHHIATDRIILEFSEAEHVRNIAECRAVVNRHIGHRFQAAMDDFGAGFQGLSLLCDVQPDIIKLDMSLVRNVDKDPRRARIVASVVRLCSDLRILPISEGVETEGELACLRSLGIDHIQGYLLARPQTAALLDQHQIDAALSLGQAATRSAV